MQNSLFLCVLTLATSPSATHLFQAPSDAVASVPVVDLMGAELQPSTAQVVAGAAQPPQLPSMQAVEPASASQPPQSNPVLMSASAFPQPVPAAAAMTQPQVKNVVKLAFGQITDLGSEFHQLHESDQAHVKQLGIDIHLREHLQQELHEAEERLEQDNSELAKATTGIVAAAPGSQSPQVEASAQSSSVGSPAALVQARSIEFQATADQIALDSDRDVKTLNVDINALHTRDVTEMKSLRGNAETRNALSAQIAKEREELMQDSGGLASNLGQIRDLVAPAMAEKQAYATEQVTLAPAAYATANPTGAVEVVSQQNAQGAAAQEPTSSDGATPAPEATAVNSWMQ